MGRKEAVKTQRQLDHQDTSQIGEDFLDDKDPTAYLLRHLADDDNDGEPTHHLPELFAVQSNDDEDASPNLDITGIDWNLVKRSEPHSVLGQIVKRITVRLKCKSCAFHGGTLSLCEQKYYDIMMKDDVCWDNDLVLIYSALLAHCHEHNTTSIKYVPSPIAKDSSPIVDDSLNTEEAWINTNIKANLKTDITRIVTVAKSEEHFVLIIFELPTSQIFVRDGLHYKLDTWSYQIDHILSKFDLRSPDRKWNVQYDDKDTIVQNDCVNCGSIASFQLYTIFEPVLSRRMLDSSKFAVRDLR
jgi:hypothetical protein